MKEVMYCVCGFSAHSGNKLAKHLGTHGCQSAYVSLEEAERARNIPAGQEDNFFIYSRDSGALQEKGEEKEKEKDEEQREDEDNVKNNDTVEKEVVEEEKETKEEDKVEPSEGKEIKEVENEEDKQPGPGGLLFGTLFKYMEEGEGGTAMILEFS